MTNNSLPWNLIKKVVRDHRLGPNGQKELLERLEQRFGSRKLYMGQIVNQAKMIRAEMDTIEFSNSISESVESKAILEAVTNKAEDEIIIDIEL